MIAQRFGFTVDILIERNTNCISGNRYIVEASLRRGSVILMRNTD